MRRRKWRHAWCHTVCVQGEGGVCAYVFFSLRERQNVRAGSRVGVCEAFRIYTMPDVRRTPSPRVRTT